jgi:hypothetical protein
MTKQVVLEGFKNSEDDFGKSLEKAAKPITDSVERLCNMEQTLNSLNCGVCTENDTLSPEEVQEVMRELFIPGNIKKLVAEHDKFTTGGLFTAETEEKQGQAAATRFHMLCSIDWLSCFSEATKEPLIRETFSIFMPVVKTRLRHIQRLRSFQTLVEDHNKKHPQNPMTQDEFVRIALKSHKILMEDKDKTEQEEVMQTLTYSLLLGKRWNDMAELLGAEAVLIGGVHDMQVTKTPNSTLNIIAIVEFGTEEEFRNLKRLLCTELQWLRNICSRLHGILPMIVEAVSLLETDQPRALALAERIEGKCIEVFGENFRSNAVDALTDMDLGITGKIMDTIHLTITISKITVPTTSKRADERMLFLTVVNNTVAELWAEQIAAKVDMTLALIEQMLYQAKKNFLSSYDKSLHQHERNSMEAERARFRRLRLSRAIDALLALVPFVYTLNERHETPNEIEDEADNKYLRQEIEKYAELFAFAME